MIWMQTFVDPVGGMDYQEPGMALWKMTLLVVLAVVVMSVKVVVLWRGGEETP